MQRRFYLPAEGWAMECPRLDAGQTHHAVEVLRLRPGSRVTVFDGLGREAMAELGDVENGRVAVVLGHETRSPALPCRITLAQAIPKGKTMDLIVQKAVELGAARVAPLISERTIVRLDASEGAQKSARWREIAIEACKQSGQNFLPEILNPSAPAGFLASLNPRALALIGSLQPGARKIKEVIAEYASTNGAAPKEAVILIGPEGDFTPAEVAAARSAGCLPVTLGPIVLRTETAAIYCLSVLAHELFG
ncbi:MAG: 16S rRNA (uracil(1498)-N(3))-methyltransferase [Terrimicrobiaceae bacterium]|nr:16S rRNA (uracil(1498)-N(3))-methyltransferase [Terrimicrobiaceae bacterium]